MKSRLTAMSLFANVGIAETFLSEIGIDVVVANEIDPVRARFYRALYPRTEMIVGDIRSPAVQERLCDFAQQQPIDLILATPPCQGMSMAGKRDPYDARNNLIFDALKIIKKVQPKYILIENVPQALKTLIRVQGEIMTIPDYLQRELGAEYNFAQQNLVSAMDYDVPQMRQRSIFLLSRKDMDYTWQMPAPKPAINLRKVLYHLPSVDPLLREGVDETLRIFPEFFAKQERAADISPYHHPPIHAKRHVIPMIYTPTGESAFHNKAYYPKNDAGERMSGHDNTYRRFEWDKPARTITQNNGVISSLCCVHPGKGLGRDAEGNKIYSDPRCLTIYELLLVSSLPPDWPIPEWAEERLVRQVIGEGIPPMLVKNLVLELMRGIKRRG